MTRTILLILVEQRTFVRALDWFPTVLADGPNHVHDGQPCLRHAVALHDYQELKFVDVTTEPLLMSAVSTRSATMTGGKITVAPRASWPCGRLTYTGVTPADVVVEDKVRYP